MHYFSFILVILLTALANQKVLAEDVNVNIRSQSRMQYTNNSLLFPAEDNRVDFLAVDARLENNGFRIAATAWSERDQISSQSKLELAEAVYDFTFFDWQMSIGKKKVDWDVGYGFRPLDMFSPTGTLALNTAVSPGTWLVSGDWFTESGTISLICNETQQNYSQAGKKTESGIGCGARHYQYHENWELQWLYHYDSEVKSRVGFSALSVLSDSLEFHSSILLQQKYRGAEFYPERLQSEYFINPVTVEDKQNAIQLLAGLNYSLHRNTNIILEYWFDGRSPSDKEWRDFIASLEPQQQALELNNNPLVIHQLSAERQMFSSHNLFQHNLMMNVRTKMDSWQPEVTALLNPIDKGLLFNPRLCYYSPSGHKFEIGARVYIGPSDSVYRQLDYAKFLYLGVEFVL